MEETTTGEASASSNSRAAESPEPPVGELVQLDEGASAAPAMMDVSLADNGDFATAPSTPNTSVSVPAQLPVTSVQVTVCVCVFVCVYDRERCVAHSRFARRLSGCSLLVVLRFISFDRALMRCTVLDAHPPSVPEI